MAKSNENANIDTAIFTTNQSIGGNGGSPFECLGINNGKRLQTISMWSFKGKMVKGVEVSLADGTSHHYGNKTGGIFQMEVGHDLITSIQIQKDKTSWGIRVTYVNIKTKSGKTMVVNEPNDNIPIERVDVGSGMCFGVFGRSGLDIDSIGFAMLRTVQFCQITDILYTNPNPKPNTTTSDLMSETFKNGTMESQSFTASGSMTTSVRSDWSVNFHFDVEVTVEESIPFIESGKVSYKVGFAVAHSWGKTKSQTLSRNWTVVCPANRIIETTAKYAETTLQMDFTAKLDFTVCTGHHFKIPVEGQFASSEMGTAEIQVIDKGSFKCK